MALQIAILLPRGEHHWLTLMWMRLGGIASTYLNIQELIHNVDG